MLEGDRKAAISAVGGAREHALDKNIKSYQRKNKECPFGSKLSSIREEMREFCDSMDKFVDENNIVFKNGEVEGFWGGRKMVDANLQTDSTGDDENRQIEIEIRAGEKDRSRRCIEEGKPRVTETMSEREAESRESATETKNTKRSENCDDQSSGNGKPVTTSEFQGVYDLMTLRTCPRVTPDSTKTYPRKETENYEPSAKMKEKPSGVYSSLFAELRKSDRKKDRNTCRDHAESSNVSNELMILEKKLYSERSTSDTQGKSLNVITDFDPEEKQSVSYNSAETNGKFAKIEILEDKFNDISLESSQEKRNVDESDDDSFKTATSIQEDSQTAGSNQQSPEVSKLRDNCDEHKNIDNPMDIYRKETVERCNNAISGPKDIQDEAEKSADRQSYAEENLSNSEQEFSEELDTQVRSFVQTIDHLSLERTSQPSRLTGKRTREAEDIEISNKKSFLIEELNPGRKPDERKPRSQISERCRQHLIQETRKFSKKVSPLIDKCITSLIKDTGNTGPLKSQYQKYDRRSLGEYLPSDLVSRNLGKFSGDSGERDSRGDKRDKSSDLTNAQLTRGQTMKGEQTGPIAVKKSGKILIDKVNINMCVYIQIYLQIKDSSFEYIYCRSVLDIQSLANLLRQCEDANKPSELTTADTGMSLYQEFCDRLDQLENKKKLLIKPDFMMNGQDKEKLSDKASQETECSMKKPMKPLIEVISEDSENTSKQTERDDPRDISDHCEKNVSV